MNPSSSPERPLVKITYAGKARRQRPSADSSEPTNSENVQPALKETSPISRKYSVEKPLSSSSTSSRKPLSKTFEFSPPVSPKFKRIPPSPKDSPSSTMPPPDQFTKAPHSRTSSITSLSQISRLPKMSSRAPFTDVISSTSSKAITRSPESSRKSPVDDDDCASVTESSKGELRIRRSEADRISYFESETMCGKLEPHSAECTKCGKVVRLGHAQTYYLRPWLNHRSRCDREEASVDGDDRDDASTVASFVTHPGARQKKVHERKALLEADPYAAEIREDGVLCKKCRKWIKLTGGKYNMTKWRIHRSRCTDVQPSERVAAAERKLQLVNDSQVKSFAADAVHCSTCDATIQLKGEGDYDLTEWMKHKATHCPCGSLDQHMMLPFPSTRPPPSSSSTDGTLIASGCERSPVQGIKRAREENDEEPSDEGKSDLRPPNRARSETYVPVEREAPSPLGWFLLPFTAFIRGFRESIGSTDA